MTEFNVTSQKNYNLNQRGSDTIHSITLMKYQKYPQKIILKHANVLAEEIKSHDVHLYKITIYNECTVLKYKYTQ